MSATGPAAKAGVAVILAAHPQAWETVGGIPVTARLVYHLQALGIRRIVLLVSEKSPVPSLARWRGNAQLEPQPLPDSIPRTILEIADLPDRFLYLDGSHLIDPRILQILAESDRTTLVWKDESDRLRAPVRAALLARRDLKRWDTAGPGALAQRARALFPAALDPYSPEIRGPVAPYLVEVGDRPSARRATRLLIASQQKQVMDLPAEFIDPPFENALTYWLCHTPVTPNMVSLLGLAIALGIAALFWHGHFVTGAILTYIVEILDGVDGKLARTKLHFSRLGEHEYLIDYFYENSWYIALAVGLHGTFPDRPVAFWAALLVVSDTLDNILYTLAGSWYGKSIDLFGPFDAAFRRIGGRRNIYALVFLVGFVMGFPYGTYRTAAVWAAVTVCVHGVRLTWYGAKQRSARAAC